MPLLKHVPQIDKVSHVSLLQEMLNGDAGQQTHPEVAALLMQEVRVQLASVKAGVYHNMVVKSGWRDASGSPCSRQSLVKAVISSDHVTWCRHAHLCHQPGCWR